MASRAAVSDETIRKLESGRHRPGDDIVASIQHALEAVGVEFTGGEPGVEMRAMKLRDAGENSFANDTVSKWVGFAALDGVRPITVLVEDLALARLDPSTKTAPTCRPQISERRRRAREHRESVVCRRGICAAVIFVEHNGDGPGVRLRKRE